MHNVSSADSFARQRLARPCVLHFLDVCNENSEQKGKVQCKRGKQATQPAQLCQYHLPNEPCQLTPGCDKVTYPCQRKARPWKSMQPTAPARSAPVDKQVLSSLGM